MVLAHLSWSLRVCRGWLPPLLASWIFSLLKELWCGAPCARPCPHACTPAHCNRLRPLGPPRLPALLRPLRRYNALQEHAAFQEGLHTCGICMEEQPGRAFARLDCRHAWCRGCLAEQARIHVAEGSLEALR